MPVALATCGITFGPDALPARDLGADPVLQAVLAEVGAPRPAHDHDVDGVPHRRHAELAVAEERDRAQVALGQAVRGDQLVAGLPQLLGRERQFHVQQPRRVVEALEVVARAGRPRCPWESRRRGCPRRRPSRSAARVRRRGSARRPSRRARRSSRSSRSRAFSDLLLQADVRGPRRRRPSDVPGKGGAARSATATPCGRWSRLRSRGRVATSSVRSMKTVATRGSGNGATAPGSKPVASLTSSVPAIRANGLPPTAAIFAASARRSPGTSTTTGRPPQSKTSDLTICPRSHPMTRAAALCGRRSLCELLDTHFCSGLARNAVTRSTGSGQVSGRHAGKGTGRPRRYAVVRRLSPRREK